MVVLIVVLAVLFTVITVGYFLGFSEIEADAKAFKISGFGVCAVVFVALGVTTVKHSNGDTYEDGQVDALKGNWKYEIRYTFKENDTIPCDTIYVEIK